MPCILPHMDLFSGPNRNNRMNVVGLICPVATQNKRLRETSTVNLVQLSEEWLESLEV